MALKKEQLHNYQIVSCEHIIAHKHCALFLEMGLGKTISTLTALEELIYRELEVDSVLIVAPKRVAETVWDAEIKNWQHTNKMTISKVIGNPKQRKIALNKKADIYIIGISNIAWLCAFYGGSRLPFDTLVIDEMSMFKNAKAKRFKSLKLVQSSFQ